MNRFKFIIRIIALLLITMAVLSCSKGDFMHMDQAEGSVAEEKGLLITGLVSDKNSGKALEDITITFWAFYQNDVDGPAIINEVVHTDSKGIYTIFVEATDKPLFCILTAEDKEHRHRRQTQQIFINWNDLSFDEERNTFVINSCNFEI